MWLCEYCDAENFVESEVCTSCGKERAKKVEIAEEDSLFNKAKAAIIANAQNKDKYEFCSMSLALKKWGKILMFACFGMGVFQFISVSGLVAHLLFISDFLSDDLMREFTILQSGTSLISSFTSALLWTGRGIAIKLLADGLAIIVHSAHLNIEPKTKRGE